MDLPLREAIHAVVVTVPQSKRSSGMCNSFRPHDMVALLHS
jgi:hypothetical protein